MISRQLPRAGVAAIILVAAGCKTNVQPTPPPPTAASLALPPAAPPAHPEFRMDPLKSPDASANPTADALAQQTDSYVKTMQPILAQRHGAPQPALPAPPPSPVDSSASRWSGAGNIPPSPTAAKPADAAPAAPPKANAPSATSASGDTNPQVALASSTHAHLDSNVPVILPESADQIPTPVAKVQPSPSQDLEQKLAQKVKDYPKDVEAQLDYQLLMYLQDQQVPQLPTVSNLSNEDREIVSAVMDGLSNFRNGVRSDPNMLLSQKVKPFMDVADRLRSQSELTIPTIALCTKVDSFGSYTPIESARFVAGKENPVIVYCEVGNFDSQLNADKKWETKLTQEVVLYTETGLPVWPEKSTPQQFTDVCRNRRHDFFLAKIVRLPANLSIGRYVLKVTVVDQEANRVAEATTPVQVVAE